MYLKVTEIQKRDIREGNVKVLLKVIEDSLEHNLKHLISNKEDTRLYQGYVQALLAIKEALL